MDAGLDELFTQPAHSYCCQITALVATYVRGLPWDILGTLSEVKLGK